MIPSKIIIGTRGSPLAMAQTNLVADKLKLFFPKLEIEKKIITTSGDKKLEIKNNKDILDKGAFTKEIEESLIRNNIDLAVHSLKDLNINDESNLKVAAVIERDQVNDILISKKEIINNDLSNIQTVGTSSERRYKLLKNINKNLDIIKIRGNINTRINKLINDNNLDSIVLAKAGLLRLGLIDENTNKNIKDTNLFIHNLDSQEFLPAACQGIIAIQIRTNDIDLEKLLSKINHRETYLFMNIERYILKHFEANCKTPLGVLTTKEDKKIYINVKLFSDNKENLSIQKHIKLTTTVEKYRYDINIKCK